MENLPEAARAPKKRRAPSPRPRSKPAKPPSELQDRVTQRLRAIQAEMDQTDEGMAEYVGASRSAWSNWKNALNMPEEEAMIRLCEKAGLTMEWIYRGIGKDVPVRLLIRLEMRLRGIDPKKASSKQKAEVAATLANSVLE